MRITWNADVNAPGCLGEIVADDGRTVLVQTDWDYPGVARTFGWDMRSVQPEHVTEPFLADEDTGLLTCRACGHGHLPCELDNGRCATCLDVPEVRECPHVFSDGTIDCPCGVKASDFIAAAREYLGDHDGATAKDPGYFTE